MTDDRVDPDGQPTAPSAPLLPPPPPVPAPELPTLPMLPDAAPRSPAAPLVELWADDLDATEHGRRTEGRSVSGAIAATPLTTAGSTVHRYSAKELAEASRIKAVDKPAYGGLPTANAESQAHAEDLRRKAAQIRNRNKRLGWYMAIAGIVVVVGALIVAFVLFQQEEDSNDEPPVTTAVATSPSVEGAGTPLGEQMIVVDGLEVINQNPVAGGGIANDVINDANNVVADLNNGTTVP